MLNELIIQNFAIIDHTHLRFGPGFNVLTGETGAGKSIILGAVHLVLGGKASKDLVRKGAESANVEARFSFSSKANTATQAKSKPSDSGEKSEDIPQKNLQERLLKLGIEPDPDGDLIIRRTIAATSEGAKTGKNRIFINGHMATRSTLVEIAQGMVDLCGQREHQILLNCQTHRVLLDHFSNMPALLNEMSQLYESLQKLYQTWQNRTENQAQNLSRKNYLTFQIEEIQKIDPKPHEDETLGEQLKTLAHAQELIQGSNQTHQFLEADGSGIIPGIHRALQQIHRMERLVPENSTLARTASLLDEALIQCQEAKIEIEDFGQSIEVDPEKMQEVEGRIQVLHQLRAKHGASLEQILVNLDQMIEECHSLTFSEEDLEKLKAQGQEKLNQAVQISQKIHQNRLKTSQNLREKICLELRELGMKEADFKVEIQNQNSSSPALFPQSPQALGLSRSGGDKIQFLLAPNKGEGMQPLHQIASGGELSRILLAIKCVLSPAEFSGSYLFDEIDSGIGGITGRLIGEKLKKLSLNRQVICITHLPQIACFSNHHIRVVKEPKGKRTQTFIQSLNKEERIQELARMLGDDQKSKTSEAHARELMRQFGPKDFSSKHP